MRSKQYFSRKELMKSKQEIRNSGRTGQDEYIIHHTWIHPNRKIKA